MSPYEDTISAPFCVPGFFSRDEVAEIVRIGESFQIGHSYMLTPDGLERRNKDRWHQFSLVSPGPNNSWLFEKIGNWLGKENALKFGFDLRGIAEPCQYNVYRAEEASHIDFHTDRGYRYPKVARKVTVTVQLSDAHEYDGSSLEIRDPQGDVVFDRALGSIIAFPSFLEHRVTPITRGIRRSLTVFYTGPSFR